jgi:hypothetical protein
MNEAVETTITERPVDSCKVENGQAVHVEYLTERVTVTTEMIPQTEAQE